ncbi:MAG: hypothetical protein K6E10_01280 [Eubacterium sp.]|nr:hypothetical protein [Eubacterium sp.]
MSDFRKRTTEYLIGLPLTIAFILPIYFMLLEKKVSGISMGFLISYSFVYQLLYFLFTLYDKKRFIVWVIPGFTAVLILMFRDMTLNMNILVTLGVFILSLLMNLPKVERFSWFIYSIIMLTLWLSLFDISKVVTVCLMILFLYGSAMLFKLDGRYYMGVLLLMGILLMFLPTYDHPMKWEFVKKAAGAVKGAVIYVINEVDYFVGGFVGGGASFSGYTENGKLTGSVTSDITDQMLVDGLSDGKMMYLEGGTYLSINKEGLYDKQNIDPLYNAWFVEFINCLYQANVDREMAACFSHVQSLDVKYTYMRTKDLIHPNNLLLIEEDLQNGLGKKEGKGFSYNLQYMEIDYASPYLLSALQSANENGIVYQDYDTIVKYTSDVYKINLPDKISEENYEKIVENINEGLPEEYLDTSFATDKLKELTMEIIDGAESDYEKAKRIETYLRQYSYSANIDLRDSDNYVEDFIFDVQKGYCVHFASSMMVMLRIAGVPSRYVGGFLHTVNASGKVTSNESHAWPEGYIKGLGWVVFEPTSGEASAESLGWNKVLKDKPIEELEEYDQYDSYDQYSYNPYVDVPESTGQIDAEVEEASEKRKTIDVKGLLKFGSYILILLGTFVLILLLMMLIQRYAYSRMGDVDKVKYNVNNLLKKLEKKMPKNSKTESIYDYLDYAEEEQRSELRKVFDIYYKVRFRGDEVDKSFIDETRRLAARIK